jgi:type I restriction enzyme S subunit
MSDSTPWVDVVLQDIAAPTRNALVGGPFGSDLVSADYVSDGVPVIRGENLSTGRWVSGEFVFVSEEKARRLAANTAGPLDIVFTQRGANHYRQVAVVPPSVSRRLVISQSQMKLTVDPEKADPLFIYYAFRAPEQQEYLRRHAIATGVPHTNLSILRNVPLRIPQVTVQREVAALLGRFDDKFELNRRMNETLEAMARALFRSWFVDFDPVRAKVEGRPTGLPPHLDALFPDSFEDSELGEIPEGWSVAPLYDIATYINGAAYAAFQPNDDRRGLPIIKIAELKAGVTAQTRFSDVQMAEKYRIVKGDILFSWSGNPDTSIDTFVWTDGAAWLNQHIFRVIPLRENERTFVLSTLKVLKPIFAEMARNKQTTGLGHVTAHDMKHLLIARPDDRIMEAWHTLASPLYGRAFESTQENHSLSSLRDSLLPKLITGELRIDRVPQGTSTVA